MRAWARNDLVLTPERHLEARLGRIEVLSVDLLETHRELVKEFLALCATLHIPLGWHYLLDLSWIASQINSVSGDLVLDAGAGWGAMQWYLSAQGVNVLSVDLEDRSDPHRRFRDWSPMAGLGARDLKPWWRSLLRGLLPPRNPTRWPLYPAKLASTVTKGIGRPNPPADRGRITFYKSDLGHMELLPDLYVDAVVAVSSLEHNSPDDLRVCLKELMRVLKPGGILAATVGGARDGDWFHEPSRGWCYSEDTIRNIFDLQKAPSNFGDFDQHLERLRASTGLRERLDPMYLESPKGGMPWGIWDPKYQPIGIIKVKE